MPNRDDIPRIPARDITPPESYFNRRTFLRGAILAGSVAATAGIYRIFSGSRPKIGPTEKLALGTSDSLATSPAVAASQADRIASGYFVNEPQTPLDSIATYNNYYEFSLDKGGVAFAARNFIAKPWTLTVAGLVNQPRTFDLDDLRRLAPLEERVYRHRCVEAWSMVIPWLGFPLSALLKAVDPKSDAKYVAFETLLDPKRMPNQNSDALPWPYVEGLRMDEAMHPLAILALGMYGQVLLPQNGAPVRLVVPWKYGFKGCKAIVKITLTATQPRNTWNIVAPNEYGFYSNVNPAVDHPRWSQASERRLPWGDVTPTLPFNGYARQVAGLYTGMDLVRNF
jgi:methionine sulfoxide reductase catalytic subunit